MRDDRPRNETVSSCKYVIAVFSANTAGCCDFIVMLMSLCNVHSLLLLLLLMCCFWRQGLLSFFNPSFTLALSPFFS